MRVIFFLLLVGGVVSWDLMGSIKGAAGSLTDSVVNTAKSGAKAVGKIVNEAKHRAGRVYDGAKKGVKDVVNGGKDVGRRTWSAGGDVADVIIGGGKNVGGRVVAAGEDVAGKVYDASKDIGGRVVNTARDRYRQSPSGQITLGGMTILGGIFGQRTQPQEEQPRVQQPGHIDIEVHNKRHPSGPPSSGEKSAAPPPEQVCDSPEVMEKLRESCVETLQDTLKSTPSENSTMELMDFSCELTLELNKCSEPYKNECKKIAKFAKALALISTGAIKASERLGQFKSEKAPECKKLAEYLKPESSSASPKTITALLVAMLILVVQ